MIEFSGFVDQVTCKLILDQPEAWRAALRDRRGELVRVVIEKPKRSSKANARYWGRIVETLRQLWSVGRPIPLTKSQVHVILVRTFLGEEETPLGWVPMETKNLPSDRFAAYCDEIEGHFTAEGVVFLDQEAA